MALLNVLHYPDKRLHTRAISVSEINDEIKQLVIDMEETMYHNRGIGLAATQVNVTKRLFIMNLFGEEDSSKLEVFINPEILEKDGEVVSEEGCLSVPGIFDEVKRAETIKVKYQSLDGQEHTMSCDGLRAICIQHEIDHLNGKVFVEYLSQLKQNFIKKKMKKLDSEALIK